MKLQLCIFTWLLNCRLERINKIDRDYSYLQFFSLVCPPEIPRFYPTILSACTDSGYLGDGPGLGPNWGLMNWKKFFLDRPPTPTPLIWKSGSAAGILKWLDWIFVGGYVPSLSIKYVGVRKDMGKRLPRLFIWRLKFLMIWVLLQSESPWQRNDAITLWREKNHFDEKWHAVVYCERVRFFA